MEVYGYGPAERERVSSAPGSPKVFGDPEKLKANPLTLLSLRERIGDFPSLGSVVKIKLAERGVTQVVS